MENLRKRTLLGSAFLIFLSAAARSQDDRQHGDERWMSARPDGRAPIGVTKDCPHQSGEWRLPYADMFMLTLADELQPVETEGRDKEYPPVYLGLCCSKCGGNMPLNIPGGGVPETHEWRLKLSGTYMNMPRLRDGTNSVSTSEALQDFMAVPTEMNMTMTSLSVAYSFTDDFIAGLMPMYMTKDMEMERRNGQQFSMKSQGPGDTMLMTKYRLYTDDPLIPTRQFSALLGLNLPTGSINEEDNGVSLPYSMQLGSGTFDPIIGLLYQESSTPWWWGANLLHTNRLYDNGRGYHLGDEFRYDLYGMYQLTYSLVTELQVNGKYSGKISGQRDDIEGGLGHMMNDPAMPFMTPLFDADNYGGHTIRLTAGLQWQPFPLHIVNLQVSYPVYQDLNGPQMEEGFQVMLSWYVEIPTGASRRGGRKVGGLDVLGF